jgi:hypothetical protein
VAKSKRTRTTPTAPAAPDDSTPPGIDTGPFDVPSEWLAEEAKRKRQRAAIDRAIAIRDNFVPPPWNETIASAKDQEGRTQRDRVRKVLRTVLYPSDGKAPARLKYTAIRAEVCKAWPKVWPRHKLPGIDVVSRVVKKIGRS